MDPTQLISRDLTKGLYLPVFGFALAYQETGQDALLIVATIMAIMAAYSDVWIMSLVKDITDEIDSIDQVPKPRDMSERINMRSLTVLVFVLTFLTYLFSIFYFGWIGYDSLLLGGLALAQLILLSRAVFKATSAGLLSV